MKLRQLDAQLLQYVPRPDTWTAIIDGVERIVVGTRDSYLHVDTLAEADGVQFLCPLCYQRNGGAVGTHSVICWFVGKVPATLLPGPGRWNTKGTSVDDLTFIPPGAVSVKLDDGCCWHGFVENGEAR